MRAHPAANTVLITGAGKRLGAAIAAHLAREGWNLLLHYKHSRDEAEALADELATAHGIQAGTIQADLGNAADVDGLIGRCVQQLGAAPFGLINNASVFDYDTIDTLDSATWHAAMDINAFAPVLLARRLSEALDGRPGCVLNILDQKLSNLNPDYFSYTVSKMALEGATRLLARALAPKGVRVCGVAPGISLPSGDQTQEEFEQAHKITPLGRSSTPGDIAAALAYLLKAEAVTGQILTVDGGQHMQPAQRDVMFLVRGA
ncbi:SDR family oxidoreductase [Massilia sp. TS11]|uniref:SDR family oxidoreductase n=1 Tax=Massilia sp. TS11 TaxID=2908003 RepID=UPI001EDA4D0E|nr:SDR family oxidoreductase [Massilia sp. TS11]MCG2582989.1 SDR family oxidoreductase [Massilia sp. TS11]